MHNIEIAATLKDKLNLDIPPIALSFVEDAPLGVLRWETEVPSACSFWRKAEKSVFYAPAGMHFNCPVGAMVMGFALPNAIMQQLGSLVGDMAACGYLAMEEAEKIPTIATNAGGIVYGPLADFPVDVDLILIWLSPKQAMLFSEAVGTVKWTSDQPTTVFGRPACAALPVALKNSVPTLSLGCAGMRTFTEIREDRLLAVLPGTIAVEMLGALEAVVRSNKVMGDFYAERQAEFLS